MFLMHLQMSKVSDTTAAQARRGKDIQGIPWDRLQFTREKYRETRLQQYKNYVNLHQPHDELEKVTDNAFLLRYHDRIVCRLSHYFRLLSMSELFQASVAFGFCETDTIFGSRWEGVIHMKLLDPARTLTPIFVCTGVQNGREGKGILSFPTQY